MGIVLSPGPEKGGKQNCASVDKPILGAIKR